MKLSTTLLPFQVNGFTVEEMVEITANAGFDALDFSFYPDGFYGPQTDCEAFTQSLLRLRGLAEDRGMVFNQAHAPFRPGTLFRDQPEVAFHNVVRAMKQAALLGADRIVVHPIHYTNYYEPGEPERIFERNMKFYGHLLPYCEEYGIRIAIENMWQYEKKSQRISVSACSRPEELCRYLDTLNSPWFAACLDIGHAQLNSDPVHCIRTLGKERLKVLHVHDVDGFHDSHTIPYCGTVDWDAVTAALAEIGYTGDFTFETDNFPGYFPKELYQPAVDFLAVTGRYLMKKIEGK